MVVSAYCTWPQQYTSNIFNNNKIREKKYLSKIYVACFGIKQNSEKYAGFYDILVLDKF